jgi:hypothetical protein
MGSRCHTWRARLASFCRAGWVFNFPSPLESDRMWDRLDAGAWIGIIGLGLAVLVGVMSHLIANRVSVSLEKRKLVRGDSNRQQAVRMYNRIKSFHNRTKTGICPGGLWSQSQRARPRTKVSVRNPSDALISELLTRRRQLTKGERSLPQYLAGRVAERDLRRFAFRPPKLGRNPEMLTLRPGLFSNLASGNFGSYLVTIRAHLLDSLFRPSNLDNR